MRRVSFTIVVVRERHEHTRHELSNPAAVQRGDADRRSQAQAVKLGLGDLRTQSFGLVDGNGDWLVGGAKLLRDSLVRRSQSMFVVDHEDDGISFFECDLRLLCGQRADLVGIATQATRIHDEKYMAVALSKAIAPVARQPREVRDERVPRAGQLIEEGRFADVGPAYQCDCRQHDVINPGSARFVDDDDVRRQGTVLRLSKKSLSNHKWRRGNTLR